MKALIFAAGLGTRLRPLTNDRPKALVELNGVTLLEVAIRRLVTAGCRELIVNVHHFAEQVMEFLEKNDQFGIRVAISDEREQLLDTGGGLKKVAWFFDDGQPFLVCNADVLTDMDLTHFYQHHLGSGALATLAVRQRSTSRYLLFDERMRLSGWRNAKTGEEKMVIGNIPLVAGNYLPSYPIPQTSYFQYAFSGLHAISPAIFDWMPDEEVFSIIDVYLNAASSGHVFGFDHSNDEWLDVGKPESLAPAAEFLKKNRNFAV